MGCSFSSYAVLGISLRKDEVLKESKKKVRSCDHNVDTKKKFCPECGKKMFETKIIYSCIDPSVEVEEGGYIGYDDDLEMFGYRAMCIEDDELVFIGYITGEEVNANYGDNTQGISLDWNKISSFKKDLKAKLEPLGLWHEDRFGLWAIGQVSC